MQSIDCRSRINEAILQLESGNKLQNDINGMYTDFVSVKMEMNEKLNSKHVRLQDSSTSIRTPI